MEEQVEKKKHTKLKIGIISLVVIALAAVIIINPLMTFHKETIELGDRPSSQIEHYMRGTEGMLNEAMLDISDIDYNQVGNYKAYVQFLFLTFTYDIEVKDTLAPEVILKEPLYIAINREYKPEDLIADVKDKSNEVSLSFEENGISYETETLGPDSVTILASDPSGNTSKVEIPYTAEKAPYFIGLMDNTIAQGSNYKPEDYVVAGDDIFGNLTPDIEVDLNGFTTANPGQYEVYYTVTNEHGLSENGKQVLTVAPQNQLMLKTWSREDILKLFEIDYFEYKPLAQANREAVLDLVAPCLVDIYSNNCKGRYLSIAGSGVIYKIDSEYMYILSNHHVLGSFVNNANDVTITFFDGSKLANIAVPQETVLDNSDIDIGMCKIKLSDVPLGILLRLKEAYHDPNYAETVGAGTELVQFATHWDGGSTDQIKFVSMRSWEQASADFNEFFSNYKENYFLSTLGAINGMSGTGIFDCRGYFVGQVAKSSVGFSQNLDINLKHDNAAKLYEKVKANGAGNN